MTSDVDMIDFSTRIMNSFGVAEDTKNIRANYITQYIEHNVDLYNYLKEIIGGLDLDISVIKMDGATVVYQVNGLSEDLIGKFDEYSDVYIPCTFDPSVQWKVQCQIKDDTVLLVSMML